MQKQLQILLEQIGYPEHQVSLLANSRIEKVDVFQQRRELLFQLAFEQPLLPAALFEFYDRFDKTFGAISTIQKASFTIRYLSEPKPAQILENWTLMIEILSRHDVMIRTLEAFKVQLEQNTLEIQVKEPSDFEHIQNQYATKIKELYNTLGFPIEAVKPIISDQAKSDADFLNDQLNNFTPIIEAPKLETPPPPPPPPSYGGGGGYQGGGGRGGYSRKEVEVTETSIGAAITAQPMNCRDVDEEMSRCTLEGYIFDAESRDIRGGEMLLVTAKFTDYTDSIYIKMFAKTEATKKMVPKVLKKGNWVKVQGRIQYDTFSNELSMMVNNAQVIEVKQEERQDLAPEGEKRVELHLHTKMSAMDGVTDIGDYIKQAAKWGHKAIALTDHGVVQAIPDAYWAAKKNNIKMIYGLEGNLVEDVPRLGWKNQPRDLEDATYVVYDVETTGFSTQFDVIIELAAVKIRNGSIIDEFSEFANPHRKLTLKIIELTHILQSDVDKAPELEDVITRFKEWAGDAILVAHNADFDMGHMEETYRRFGLGEVTNPVIDTLALARVLYHHQYGVYWQYATSAEIDDKFKRKLKRFNLKALAKLFKVDLTQHHRAIYDARATGQAFILMLKDILKLGVTHHDQLGTLVDQHSFKLGFADHIIVLAKNDTGFKNLFKVVSQSMTEDLYGTPRIRRGYLQENRDGLLIGSACVNGEVFQAALNKPYEEMREKAKFYDYLEVQPPEVYSHLIDLNSKEMATHILDAIQKVIKVGEELGIPVVATGDAHHLNRDDKLYRQIYTRTPMVGGGRHPLNNPDIKSIPSMHFRTTDEMLNDFHFLPEAKRKEIVVTNPNLIADSCENIKAIKDELFTPSDDFLKDKGIPSIKDKLSEMCYERAYELYGKPLPQYVADRMDKELKSIIGNGFAVIYYISHMLVKKSLDDGYLVGSRGSIGSSFVATLTDITEVNPLSPHYRCPTCLFSTFKMNEEEKGRYGLKPEEEPFQTILAESESGFDLPDRDCPHCQIKMKKDGHDIPFETFLGFKGDKVPDIDLNFSGEYQPIAHLYCREVFGMDFAFRAGTIGTVAEKTAYGYVKGFLEDTNKVMRSAEIERIAKGCEGVRRTSGQHPGGIIVVPEYMDIYDITPIQYPADDPTAEWRTTHFDFHSIHDNLLKLDILGHDDPTVLRFLQDISGMDPQDIPTDCPEVYKLFSSTESLGVTPQQIRSTTGSYGVPEFGTSFVRSMLEDTKPKSFAELVKISGLSHGTDVWLNNAADLVGGHEKFGKVPFKNVIGCRDDIMVYLMYGGLEPALAFKIMEFVRKGMASKNPEGWKEMEAAMREHKIPEWYIWSCGQIKYMFPKAHATAYVLMAIRIAWFKVHKPIYYYCAYFSKRASVFEMETMVKGADAIRKRLEEIEQKGFDAEPKEKNLVTILEIALEMTERGFYFQNYSLEESNAIDFKISADEKSLIPPFTAMDGLGENVALQMVAARDEEPFATVKDVQKRGKVSKSLIEKFQLMGTFGEMPLGDERAAKKEVKVDRNQLSLF